MSEDTMAQLPSNTGTILVVDDEAMNRELLRELLEAKGHMIVEAENGDQALDQISSDPPDVVLLDVMMPGIDGFEVCRRIKDDPGSASIPVLLVTALRERDDRLQGIQAGANDFITKPIDSREVALRVNNAVFTKKLFDQVQKNYEQLKELSDLRDNLTHMIVHDLRSPLTGIQGFLELLQMKAAEKLEEDELEYIKKALGGCSTLIEMISSLLDVNRLEAGEMPLDITDCELGAIADEAIQAIGAAVPGVKVKIDKPDEPVNANCDPEIMCRIISNLVGNALKFSPKGSEVKVSLEKTADSVRVSVKDSGPGIPPEYRDRIFEKFGQVEARSERKKYSTGLGLTFCKLAVEAHNGKIWLDSEVGCGSTFWFEIPLEITAGVKQV